MSNSSIKITRIVSDTLKTKFDKNTSIRYSKRIYESCSSLLKRLKFEEDSETFNEKYAVLAYHYLGQLMSIEDEEEEKKVIEDVSNKKIYWTSHLYIDYVEKINKDNLNFINPPVIHKGLHKCRNPSCKSDQTITFMAQTRSGDEGMTGFSICTRCGSQRKV
jgi:DNA-directed RNA polymerase subunit M/transcription elongation factor TFIIS